MEESHNRRLPQTRNEEGKKEIKKSIKVQSRKRLLLRPRDREIGTRWSLKSYRPTEQVLWH